MSYDVPTALNPAQQALQGMNWRQQLKHGFKDMGARSYSSAKNFGMVGTIYAGTSCGIESVSSSPHAPLSSRSFSLVELEPHLVALLLSLNPVFEASANARAHNSSEQETRSRTT